jgi:CRP/FNR family transcriptional regulator, cyclic AMP receptor protein
MAGDKNGLGCQAEDLRRIFDERTVGLARLRCNAGKTIYNAVEPFKALFYVERGHVAVSVVLPAGKEAVVGLRGPGDFFGLRSVMKGAVPVATAVALTDCLIARIQGSALPVLLRTRPEFSELLLGYLLRQYDRDQGKIVSLLTSPAEKRLAWTLQEIGSLRPEGAAVAIKINQTMLANMVGTTRSRVSHFMNKLKRARLIQYDRHGYFRPREGLLKALENGDC